VSVDLACGIFLVLYSLIVWERFSRVAAAVGGAAAMTLWVWSTPQRPLLL
jgi:hypothetical protein